MKRSKPDTLLSMRPAIQTGLRGLLCAFLLCLLASAAMAQQAPGTIRISDCGVIGIP